MRFVAMLATLALASALAGCPKKEDPPPGSTNPPSSASLSAAKTAAPPPVADWQEVKVKAAKLSVKIPKGASIAEDKAGADEAFAGSYFRVKMASGYDLYFGVECLAVVRHRPVHHRPLIFSRSTSVTSCQKIERQGRIGRAYALRARGTRVASPKT